MEIKYLLPVVCCILSAEADSPWKRFLQADGGYSPEDINKPICPKEEGTGIVAYGAHLYSGEQCGGRDPRKLMTTSSDMKRIRTSCNGKIQCNISGSFIYPCGDHPILAKYIDVEIYCKPVVPDDNKVYDISKNYVNQSITAHYKELYLVMKIPEDNGTVLQRECTLRGHYTEFDLQLLHADLGSQNRHCGSLSVTSSNRPTDRSLGHLTCNNSSSLQSDDFVDDVREEMTLRVSMASGFLWMKVEAAQSFQLSCSSTSAPRMTILASTVATSVSSSNSPVSYTTHGVSRALTEKKDDDDDDDDDGNNMMIIIIVVSLVAVAAIVIILLLCLAFVCNCNTPLRRWASKRQRQRKQQQQQYQQQGEQQQLQQQPVTYEYITEDDLNSNARSPQTLIPPPLRGNKAKNKPNKRDTNDEEYTEVSINTRRDYKNSSGLNPGADKPVMPVKPTVYSEPHASNINMAVVSTSREGDLTEVTYDVADPQKAAVRPVPHGAAVYSVTSLPKSPQRTGGATYDTMATITGEYARLNRPGDGPKVIDNIYDG